MIKGIAYDTVVIQNMLLTCPVVTINTSTLESNDVLIKTKELLVVANEGRHLIIGTNGRNDLDKKETIKARLISHYVLKKAKIISETPKFEAPSSGDARRFENRSFNREHNPRY